MCYDNTNMAINICVTQHYYFQVIVMPIYTTDWYQKNAKNVWLLGDFFADECKLQRK